MESIRPNVLEEIATVRLGSTQQRPHMQVFGLLWDALRVPEYMTLDEALLSNVLDVTEISERARVPEIRVMNRSEDMIFLMAGEILAGCKQDRVLNTSLMLPPRSAMSVPVACVEAGRWYFKSHKFGNYQSCSHFHLRRVLFDGTSAMYRSTGAPGSDQGAVWGEIERKMQKMKFQSPTSAIRDFYEATGDKFAELERNFGKPDGCQGAAFVVNGKILGADLFDTQSTLSKLWPKIIRSYGIDALENSGDESHPVQSETVAKWLQSAITARKNLFKSPGVGQDVRMEAKELSGAALLVEGRPVHVQLLSTA